MKPTIVPDTTEVDRTDALTGGGWGELLTRCRRGDVSVVVPDVVIREAARHFGPAVKTDLVPTKRRLKMLQALGLTDLPDLDVVSEAIGDPGEFYVDRLRKRLEDHGAAISPLPAVGHEQLVSRDLAGRKPFRAASKGEKGGRGYRDALIWETILELVRSLPEDEQIYFIGRKSAAEPVSLSFGG